MYLSGAGSVGRVAIKYFIPRHIGDFWETAGVSQIAVFQVKLLATKLPFLPGQGKLPHSLLPLFLQRSAVCHSSYFIAVLFPSGRVGLLKMMLSTPPSAILLVVSVFCSRQVWSESVLNWQGPGAVHARKSGKDPP